MAVYVSTAENGIGVAYNNVFSDNDEKNFLNDGFYIIIVNSCLAQSSVRWFRDIESRHCAAIRLQTQHALIIDWRSVSLPQAIKLSEITNSSTDTARHVETIADTMPILLTSSYSCEDDYLVHLLNVPIMGIADKMIFFTLLIVEIVVIYLFYITYQKVIEHKVVLSLPPRLCKAGRTEHI